MVRDKLREGEAEELTMVEEGNDERLSEKVEKKLAAVLCDGDGEGGESTTSRTTSILIISTPSSLLPFVITS